MAQLDHRKTREGNLHDLGDDEYFAAIDQMPAVYDAQGNDISASLFEDVIDARELKAAGEAVDVDALLEGRGR